MKSILIRAAVLIGAVAFTLFVFNFWGNFGHVLDNYLTAETKADKPKDTGEVTLTIIPQKPAEPAPHCDKKHPCP